jgi:hypothetical protein
LKFPLAWEFERMESEQIYSTLQAELASVQSKVNSWSLNKEKELQQLKSSHTAFLDSHNGASSPLPRRPLQGLHASNLQRSQAKARLTRAAPSQSSHSSSSPGKSRSRHARRRTRRVRHFISQPHLALLPCCHHRDPFFRAPLSCLGQDVDMWLQISEPLASQRCPRRRRSSREWRTRSKSCSRH